MNLMAPELRRAIIKIVPEYFSWDQKHQELYRVDTPEVDSFKIRQYLLKELFDISVSSDEEFDDAWSDLTDEQSLRINTILLPLQGIGEDYFFLNEYFGSEKNLLSFKTLYDYDFDDFQFQEESRKENIQDYQGKPYRGSIYYEWARLMIDESFCYASLCMVSEYLYSELEEFGNEYIEKLIPHEFKHGKNHGKDEGSGYLFDIKTDAKGLEPQLDELNYRFQNHINTVHERIIEKYDKSSMQGVYIVKQSKQDDPSYLFLFTDKEILRRIYFKSFMRCCRDAEEPDQSDLYRKLDVEKTKLTGYLDAQYEDIMENFDPKIKK